MSRPVQPTIGDAVHSPRGRGTVRRLFRIYLEKPELAGVVLLVVLAAFSEFRSHGVFLSPDNLRGVLGLLPEVGLVAIGVTILMICGEFDLSVGSVFALMPMSRRAHAERRRALRRRRPARARHLRALIGFVNGFVTIRFAIPSFITTLGMLFMARSLTVVISGGFPPLLSDDLPLDIHPVSSAGRPVALRSSGSPGIALLAIGAMLARPISATGSKSTGGFLEAAASMGIPVNRVEDHLLHALLDACRLCRD